MVRRFAFAVIAALAAFTAPATAQSLLDGTFDAAIPTLQAHAGYRPGEQITRPEVIETYLAALAAASPERMRVVRYATSWEGRPLSYAILTSPANMARLDAIRADTATLAAGATPAQAQAIIARSVPVTWLSYGVHGDEISSSDAALVLAYHLLAAQGDATVDSILQNSVVIIDPSQNPDGRARFVNSYYQQLGLAPSGNRDTAGPDQPWPGGRFNHYLFDLNRDWFALTQPESRGKVAAVRDWQPVVFVDAHEMGGDETYFFPPSAEPFNPFVTPTQRERQSLLGRANGAALDALGVPYYTREVFDLFYPGYGDTWPTLNGAVGMTFEQSSARGLLWQRRDGGVLTYGDGVRNHFTTTLETAATVARNAGTFLADYADYRRSAAAGAEGRSAYLIDLAGRRWNAEMLGRRLALQGIAVSRVGGPASACGRSYPQGYLAVRQNQPTARLIRSLLDADVELPPAFITAQEERRAADLPHELYDTTAWSLGLMSGVGVTECASPGSGSALAEDAPMPARASQAGSFGMVVPWSDSGQAQLVARAAMAGIRGRVTDEAFGAEGREFPRGSVVFTLADNGGDLAPLTALAQEIGAETVPLGSGWVDSGPNLGSDSFTLLSAPRVAMLWDDGISPLSAGSTRYVIEQRLGLPVAPIRTGTLAQADLSEFDVLIAPDGDPGTALAGAARAAVLRFVADGGVLVAYGEMLASLSQGEDALFASARETVLGGEVKKAEAEAEGDLAAGSAIGNEADYRTAIADRGRSPDTLPGALLNTVADARHFLSAGYDGSGPVVVADGALVLTPLARGDGTNVVRFAAPEALVASGYVWSENRRQLAFKPYMMAQETGRGLAIGFVHDPSVRGYLDGLDLLLANAVLVAPSRVR